MLGTRIWVHSKEYTVMLWSFCFPRMTVWLHTMALRSETAVHPQLAEARVR